MPIISSAIPNMINGLSQQPPALRRSVQCDFQKNAYPSVVEGLGKRPPLQHVTKISTGTLGAAYIHTINRDVDERYKVILTDGDLKVYTLDGTEKTVAFPDGKAYLTSTDPKTDFRAVSVIDYTFIVNTATAAAMDAALSPDRGIESLVFVKVANYTTDYNVSIDGINRATHTTGTTGGVKTTTIASDLTDQLSTNLAPAAWVASTAYALDDLVKNGGNVYKCTTAGTSAGSGGPTGTGTGIADNTAVWDFEVTYHAYTIVREGSVIHIKRDDTTDFEVKAEDSRSNTQMRVAKDSVQRFSDLPTIAPTDFVVEVIGDNTSSFDNYFVKFTPNNDTATFDEGVWVETVKPGIEYKLDASTMPYGLVRESDGTFTFSQVAWGERTAGDLDSAPEPSFIGRKVRDIFFEDTRLGVLADESVVESRKGEFFEFFVSTVTTIVESDPVDTAASHTKASILRHAVPFHSTMLLFSDQTQFKLEKNDTTGIKEVKVLTEYESSTSTKPVGSGKTVFFATEGGNYSGIKEYFIDDELTKGDDADVTAHVPKYLPKNVFKLAAAPNDDVLFVLSSDDPNKVYVYKYYWAGDDKVQSAWSHFEFSANAVVLNVDFIGAEAYFIIQYPDGVYLEKIGVAAGRKDANATFEYLLDRKISNAHSGVVVAYDVGTDLTTWTLPYELDGNARVVTRHYAAPEVSGNAPGVILTLNTAVGDTITAFGDYSTTPVFIGQMYEARYRWSKPYLKEDADGGGKAVVTEGRLQIKFWTVTYDATGFFRVEVTPDQRDMNVYKFTGTILGSSSAVLGDVNLSSGTFKVPVMSRNDRFTIEVINDTHLPSNFVSAGWEGFYSIRSKRV